MNKEQIKDDHYKPKHPFTSMCCPKNHSFVYVIINYYNPVECYCLKCEGLTKDEEA